MPRIFPVVPSPFDSRDYIYENLVRSANPLVRSDNRIRSTLPKKLDLRKYLLKPRDQGQRGTCVGFSCSAIKEYQERIDIQFSDYMSPNSVYFYREVEEGMYCRNAMKILLEKGICPEKYFPYEKRVEPTKIPDEAVSNMGNYKIKSYAQVTTIQGLKESLNRYGPALIAVPVYRGDGEIWKSDPEHSELLGGHAMTVVGYNDKGFIIRNSWGEEWNGDGHTVYPYADWGSHWEIWTCVDEKSNPEIEMGCCLRFWTKLVDRT